MCGVLVVFKQNKKRRTPTGSVSSLTLLQKRNNHAKTVEFVASRSVGGNVLTLARTWRFVSHNLGHRSSPQLAEGAPNVTYLSCGFFGAGRRLLEEKGWRTCTSCSALLTVTKCIADMDGAEERSP